MSISIVPREPEHQQDQMPELAPTDVYEQLIQENSDICPRCLRWRGQDVAVGAARDDLEIERQQASVDVATVVREAEEYPTLTSVTAPAHVPAARVCECGDIDRGGVPTRSKDRALELTDVIARRLGEFGFVYDHRMLRAVVRKHKSRPETASDDDLAFERAVAAAIVKARGQDPIRELTDHGTGRGER